MFPNFSIFFKKNGKKKCITCWFWSSDRLGFFFSFSRKTVNEMRCRLRQGYDDGWLEIMLVVLCWKATFCLGSEWRVAESDCKEWLNRLSMWCGGLTSATLVTLLCWVAGATAQNSTRQTVQTYLQSVYPTTPLTSWNGLSDKRKKKKKNVLKK